MVPQAKTFRDFWAEVKTPFLRDCVKIFIRLPVAIVAAIVVIRAMQCAGWMGDESDRAVACAEIWAPKVLASNIVNFLPKLFMLMVVGLPWLLLGGLYLEWDKYKKDKPHGFGVYGMRTAPNGGWMRLNFDRLVTGKAWEKYDDVQLNKISDSENHLCGHFTDQEVMVMVKAVSRRFTSFLRKPTVENAQCIEWHIHANSGEEVRLRLEPVATDKLPWVLTAYLYEWAGRKQPARLIQTHVTRFGLSTDVAVNKLAPSAVPVSEEAQQL